MSIYDTIMYYLFYNGPIVSLFRWCVDQSVDYSWAWQQVQKMRDSDHVHVSRIHSRGCPDRLEITHRGALYIRSNMPGGAA